MISRPTIAIVIGGADGVLDDVAFALELVGDQPRTIFATNDMIADYRDYQVAVTLHPDKLPMWLARRAENGWAAPPVIWAHRPANKLVTNFTPDWAGSVSLFACKVALETKHSRIIVCGAPLTVSKHYRRGTHWTAALGFRRGWTSHMGYIRDGVRSCSGWTRDLLGAPTAAWLGTSDGTPQEAKTG